MIKTLSLIFAILILSFTTGSKQEKEYTVKASVQEWNIILSNQDDVAKSVRDKVVQKFASQLNQQIISDTTKKK